MLSSTFKIYSASAGSGKTYTLAKAYIKLLISSKNNEHFRNILAITFTNKAVGEMKARIIDKLKLFSLKSDEKFKDSMFIDICNELKITNVELEYKSYNVLQKIVHNYGAFEISTIDAFVHRVIRTFAFDLNLPVNFEVELDQNYILNKAVDRLISKAGIDKELTKTLIDFAVEKTDDDKSWDVSIDFFSIGKLLLSENDLPYIERLKKKTLRDFNALKNHLQKFVSNLKTKIINNASSVLTLIQEAGLEYKDFKGQWLPKHFIKLSEGNFNVSFSTAWQNALLENNDLTKVKEEPFIVDTIRSIQPQIAEAFTSTKKLIFSIKFNEAIYKNITPLSILNALQKELNNLKDEENKILISEFNTLISNEIKSQPTPFIYERLGEKFKHYFIDEFQDTSKMQWYNLMPLIDNTLSSSGSSVMLVGDAKQSIYRWRGGNAEQFIDLYSKPKTAFPHTESNVENLGYNYRSSKEIVSFNNSFFDFIAKEVFQDSRYSLLYKQANQKLIKDDEGYVNISFVDYNNTDEATEQYSALTYEKILECQKHKYQLKDICVLVRKKKDGIAISNYLTSQGISIISSETLLLKNSPKIQLLNSVFLLLVNPNEKRIKLDVLANISRLINISDIHDFFKKHVQLEISDFFSALKKYDIELDYKQLIQTPIAEAAENLVRGFKLCEKESDAYVQSYLDVVLDFTYKEASNISRFLDYFDSKKENLSISVPNNLNAVSIMTIHKSKGLEFPVVIFPFADLDIYEDKKGREWFPLNPRDYLGFDNALINYKNEISEYSDVGFQIYHNHKSQLELDNINLLYVTLTRAEDKMYIISKKNLSSTALKEQKSFSSLFINYLRHIGKWSEHINSYEFGKNISNTNNTEEKTITENYTFISKPKDIHNLNIITKNGQLWETEQQEAILYGNLLHIVMSKIETKKDIEEAIDAIVSEGLINNDDVKKIHSIVESIIHHKKLSKYYSDEYIIHNEKEIITENGEFLRPDRLAIKNDKVIVIDYKTGAESTLHKNQINRYASVLEDMNYSIDKKLLIYTNSDLNIIEV